MDLLSDLRTVLTFGLSKVENYVNSKNQVQHIEIDDLINRSPAPSSSRSQQLNPQEYLDLDGTSDFNSRLRRRITCPSPSGNFQKSTQEIGDEQQQELQLQAQQTQSQSSTQDHNFPAAAGFGHESLTRSRSNQHEPRLSAGDLHAALPTSWHSIHQSHSERFYEEMNYFIRPKFADAITDLTDQGKREKEDKVRSVALTSRLILLFIQILSASLIPRHENDGFRTPRDNLGVNGTALDRSSNFLFGGFVNWDGEYFLHITTNGYTIENAIAFFPLFPAVVASLARALNVFFYPFISLQSLAQIISWCVNTWCFTESAVDLLKLVKYFDNGLYCLDEMVLILFCYNPASIFFSSYYSESIFAYTTINVLVSLYEKDLVRSIRFAAFSAVCRSNGLLNFGFIGAYVLKNLLTIERRYRIYLYQKVLIFRHYCWILLQCALGLVPFVLFQMYCSWKFCGQSGSEAPAEALKLCDLQVLPYMYIQAKNWNVGFLRYFEPMQLPNFLLAAPVLSFLGFEAYKRTYFYGQCVLKLHKWNLMLDLAMGIHGLFLTVFCLFFIHVQVSTRMILSSCPYLYIYIAKSLRTELCRLRAREINYLPYTFTVHTWCLTYFVAGTLLFSRGYPWT